MNGGGRSRARPEPEQRWREDELTQPTSEASAILGAPQQDQINTQCTLGRQWVRQQAGPVEQGGRSSYNLTLRVGT